ncbi:M48 family metallopeptidase [Thermococcus barophilus]|uniref:Peptidase n=1 Tax=Thermococcus barophilus (strain DSM 11836 / MP) TaxID=391623 RepID=F0LK80_THEBM|nr:M48 family metallopeptidase [Thermococcus barophilus]ADT84792.1 peptidase [Thermococcus barophilus MP]
MDWVIFFLVISIITITVPPLIMRLQREKILKGETSNDEKMYKGTKLMLLCIILAIGLYFPPVIGLGILDKVMEPLAEHISSPFLGALIFMGVFITPLLISIMLTILVASKIEVEVKGLNIKTWETVKGILKAFAFLLLPGIVWLGIYLNLPEKIRNSTLASFGVFVIYILSFFALSPYLTRFFGKPRQVPEPLRTELLKFCESLGFKVRDIRVTGKKEYKIANAGVTGILPWARYIFITEYMLETFEPEEIKAVIAHEIGHIKGRHLWINALIAIGWFGFWMGIVFALIKLGVDILSPVVFFGVFFSAYIIYFVVIQGKISLRNEFKADEFAAKVIGKETVIKTLEKLAEVNLTPKKTGKWFGFLSFHPSIEERIRHLEEVAE